MKTVSRDAVVTLRTVRDDLVGTLLRHEHEAIDRIARARNGATLTELAGLTGEAMRHHIRREAFQEVSLSLKLVLDGVEEKEEFVA